MNTSYNPLAEICEKLDILLARTAETKSNDQPKRISMAAFCEREGVARCTVYDWAKRGYLELEKVGGRVYIVDGSTVIKKKYQREEQPA